MPHPLPDQIDTRRLCLRRPDLPDAHSLFQAYTQDRKVCRYMVWQPHASESVTRAFVESCIAAWNGGGSRPYVIVERAAIDDAQPKTGVNPAIGMIDASLLGATVDVGYVLARAHWGRGLIPEALSALTDAALRSSAIFRVQATCDTENTPSQRTLEKSGFVCEGKLARHTVHPNLSPEPRACFMYARVR